MNGDDQELPPFLQQQQQQQPQQPQQPQQQEELPPFLQQQQPQQQAQREELPPFLGGERPIDRARREFSEAGQPAGPSIGDRVLATAQQAGGQFLKPFTEYWPSYLDVQREGREQITHGLEQLLPNQFPKQGQPTGERAFRPDLWETAKGAGNVALGAYNYLTAPIGAAARSLVGKPVAEITGSPTVGSWAEFAANLAVPGVGLTRLPGAAAREIKSAGDAVVQRLLAGGTELNIPNYPRPYKPPTTPEGQLPLGEGATRTPVQTELPFETRPVAPSPSGQGNLLQRDEFFREQPHPTATPEAVEGRLADARTQQQWDTAIQGRDERLAQQAEQQRWGAAADQLFGGRPPLAATAENAPVQQRWQEAIQARQEALRRQAEGQQWETAAQGREAQQQARAGQQTEAPYVQYPPGSQLDLPEPLGPSVTRLREMAAIARTEGRLGAAELYKNTADRMEGVRRDPVPHGPAGPEAAAGVAESAKPTASAAPTEFAPVRAPKPGPEDYGKPPATATGERGGVNVGHVDPDLQHALRPPEGPMPPQPAPARVVPSDAAIDAKVGEALAGRPERRVENIQPPEANIQKIGQPQKPSGNIVGELDPKLANRLLNQPAALRAEAAKRGVTPEALKAQAQDVLRSDRSTALEREPIVRGRSGRPVETAPLPIGTEGQILERGLERATGPKGEPREPYIEAVQRQGPPKEAPKEAPKAPARVRTQDGAVFTGKDVETARANALNAGYRPHQIIDAQQPTAAKVPTAPEGATAAPAAGERQRTPKEKLVEEGKEGNKQAFKAAEDLDDRLHQLTATPAGKQYEYYDKVTEGLKKFPEQKGEGMGRKIYDAIVSGTYDKLPKRVREGYEYITGTLQKENKELRKELADRGVIEHVADDPRYIHRLAKMPSKGISDPISDVRGNLPGMRDPSSVKELAFRGAEDAKGNRIVISGGGDEIAVMKNGKVEGTILNPNQTGPLKTGDKVNYKNVQYTVDRGIESEIEQHARLRAQPGKEAQKIEYHRSPIASVIAENNELKQLKAYHDLLDEIKAPDGPFSKFMTRDIDEAKHRGWKESELRDLKTPDGKTYYLHPDLWQAIHNNYNPGMGMLSSDLLRSVNQFAVRSMFWNPVPHGLNATMHYNIGRGWDWIPMPSNRFGANWVQSLKEGFEAAITQNQLLQDLNKSGASMVMSKIDRQNLIPNVGKLLETNLKANPGPYEVIARNWGLGKPIDVVKAWYDGAQRVLWTWGDALMAARVRELELNNPSMTRAEAIDKAAKHIPDYRLGLTFLGSRGAVNLMSDQTVSAFGRYHMGLANSLIHMGKDLAVGTKAERIEALGNVLALGVFGYLVKPMLDKAVQTVTGNEKAEVRPRGPLAVTQGVGEVISGKKDYSQVLGHVITPSPAAKTAMEVVSGKDLFTGKPIISRAAPVHTQALQAADYALGKIVSPYGTFGPTLQPGSSKGDMPREIAQQLLDVKVPTARQIAGEQKAGIAARREATQRARRPRGLLEYGGRQLERSLKE